MGKDDISLVSSTDTVEDVAAALTGTPAEKPPVAEEKPAADAPIAEPVAEKPSEPEKPAEPAKPAAEAAAKPNETPAEKIEREKRGSRERRLSDFDRQIGRLTAEKHGLRSEVEGAQARRDALAVEIADLEKKKAALASGASVVVVEPSSAGVPPTVAAAISKDPEVISARAVVAGLGAEPKLDDVDGKGNPKYASWEDWAAANGKFVRAIASAEAKLVMAEEKAKLRLETTQADRARIEHDQADRAAQDADAKYQDDIVAFKARTPDFDAALDDAKEFVDELVEVHGPQVLSIVDGFTLEDAVNKAALQYHLARNPEELREIVALPPRQQIAALARLDERVGSVQKAPARAPASPPVTQAPEPMKPVGGAPSASTVSSEDEDYATYKARRNREEREAALAR